MKMKIGEWDDMVREHGINARGGILPPSGAMESFPRSMKYLCGRTVYFLPDIHGVSREDGWGIEEWMLEPIKSENMELKITKEKVMTKYSINPELTVPEKQEPKKTVFKKFVGPGTVLDADYQPKDFGVVQLLWRDKRYGDVFAAWDDDLSRRVIYFGEAGDEFGQLPPKPQ